MGNRREAAGPIIVPAYLVGVQKRFVLGKLHPTIAGSLDDTKDALPDVQASSIGPLEKIGQRLLDADVSRLVDDTKAGVEGQRRDAAAAVMRIRERGCDCRHVPGVDAAAQAFGDLTTVGFEPPRQVAHRVDPLFHEPRRHARQHRIGDEKCRQTVLEHCLHESAVPFIVWSARLSGLAGDLPLRADQLPK